MKIFVGTFSISISPFLVSPEPALFSFHQVYLDCLVHHCAVLMGCVHRCGRHRHTVHVRQQAQRARTARFHRQAPAAGSQQLPPDDTERFARMADKSNQAGKIVKETNQALVLRHQ